MTAGGEVIDSKRASDLGLSGLATWLRAAAKDWEANKRSDLSLTERWNYYSLLASQHPIASLRVVYAKAGIDPAACLLRDEGGIVDHKLYWIAVENESEGHYLTAILNAEEARSRVAHLQSRGLFGARDFDKVMLTLPIPRFSPADPTHAALARLGEEAETLAATVNVPPGAPFTRARRLVRDALKAVEASRRIDEAVAVLLD
ncbi:MAG: hypothetical protein JOZ27_07055 [Caulobacteraceae bacterium]|nr:hypothetical protein [Caulobacteraceae bacterium]